MAPEQARGITAIKRIKREHNLNGVYGPLIELFECTETEMIAVEVAGKSQLFNVVVDTDDTASKVLNILNKEKAGRVTFMPLNKLMVKEPTYPKTETTMPMIERLLFKPMYRKAMLHVFGKTIICSNMEEGATISRNHNVDCITVEGDKINRKGALTGGYYDTRTNRLATMSNINRTQQKIVEIEDNLKKVKKSVGTVDEVVNRILNDMQELDQRRARSREEFDSFNQEASSSQKKLLSLESLRHEKSQLLNSLEVSIRQLEESQKSLQSEVGKKLLSKLSDEEQRELTRMNTDLTNLKNRYIEAQSKRAEMEAQKSSEENRLTNNLLSRQEELEKQLSLMEFVQVDTNVQRTRQDLDVISESLSKTDTEYRRVDARITELSVEEDELKSQIDILKEKESEASKRLQDESKSVEKFVNQRSLLQQKRDDIQKKLRDIGSLPSKSQKEFEDRSVQELLVILQKTKQTLKNFNNVNKKALDQYVHFKERREKLEEKKQELDEGEKAIFDLIKVLDYKKDEAIERTLKMVAKFFSEVFQELTGEGAAELVMQKKVVEEEEGEASQAEVPQSAVQQYKGVDVNVSFTQSGKRHRMHQLSGGQQSLVALALIFAIQVLTVVHF
eukprot:TRINITY_DN7501_c0_g1_i1.p1 TRINITY_DN7501_c0_g1~~TRINITY_DN7501_c0_g1_i1.p1  ORF type:complete len:658 (-),score=179.46 TRINITY_DN7501_c0_g1_i1:792-2645(-)